MMIDHKQVLLALARTVGLSGDDLAGLMALVQTRKTADFLSQGLLNGEVCATYTGPREADGTISADALLDSRHYLFHPKHEDEQPITAREHAPRGSDVAGQGV